MSVIYIALPVALLLVFVAFWAFRWSVKSGQLDDLETPAHRAIFEDCPNSSGGRNSQFPTPHGG